MDYKNLDTHLYNMIRTNANLEYNNHYCDDTYYLTLREITNK